MVTKDYIKQLTVATVATNHAMLVDEILADCWSKDHRPLLAAMLRGAPADRDSATRLMERRLFKFSTATTQTSRKITVLGPRQPQPLCAAGPPRL